MATTVTTAWLPPTTATTPSYNGNATLWVDKDNALVYDSQYAVATAGSYESVGIYLFLGFGGSGSGVGQSVTESIHSGQATTDNGQPITYQNLVNNLSIRPTFSVGAGASFNNSALQLKDFDFSSIPVDSNIQSIDYRVYYKLTSTQMSINYAEVRVTYSPPDQGFNPVSIASAEAFDSPSLSPGITYVDLADIASAEAFDSPSLSMTVYPGSASSAEAFGSPTMTIFAATLGDIASAESVSEVSFTTQFITSAGAIDTEEDFGTLLITMNMTGLGAIASTAAFDSPVMTQSPPPPPPPTDWSAVGKQDEKVYMYKVSTRDGDFIGVWTDASDDLQFTERINSPGTTTTIYLARSVNTKREVRDVITTEAGDGITTEDSNDIVAVSETPNSVGEGTDVELNYNVDIFVHYGELAELITELGDVITTEDGDMLMVAHGAPLGTPIFRGYILDYDATYGEKSGVIVTVASHGYELSDAPVLSGADTTVSFSSAELGGIAKSIIDTNPGKMSYTGSSIANTSVSQAMKFQLNNKLEAIQSIHDQTPAGWWWRGDVSDNNIYLQPLSTSYNHTFVLGWHIKNVSIKRSMEGLKNLVYFVGGQTDPEDVNTTKFKMHEDADSRDDWRTGLERITDRRYTIDASILARSQKVTNTFGRPVFTSVVSISSGRYDIESIKVGETVGFKNSGTYIDGVPPLQIVSRQYSPTAVILTLGALLDRQVDTLSEAENAVKNEAYQNIPNSPS